MTATSLTHASAHVDTFARDNLPPPALWPELDCSMVPYPPQLNCATALLEPTAAADGARTVFLYPGGRWSYRELLVHANRIAHVLVDDLGLVPGNRVLLRGPNHPLLAACWFAVLKAGGICVCTMPLLRARELSYIVAKARVGIALTDTRVAAELDALAGAGSLRHVVHFGTAGAPGSLEALSARKPDHFDDVATAADDVAIIAFTSGTTGQAKGTMHFHRDILAVTDTFSRHVLKPEPDDIFCGSPPFGFTFGLGGLVLFPMRVGATSLLLEQAAPPLLLDGSRAHGATICFTAPTAYRAMLPLVGNGGVGRLRRCVSAGETLPRATFDAWEQATGIRIIDGIGATEMLHIFISAADDDIRPGSTGRVVPGFRACVLDADGAEVPRGTVGRLAVRGPTGCRYLADPERQRAYVQHGWNITGDAYIQDEDGYFWYQARTDDMIISGGYNISGPEVENVLLEHPFVQECAVIATPDEERGHVVKAVVVLRAGTPPGPETGRALQDFVKAEIAPYKYPRIVEFADALPRTETGKLQRFRLREPSRVTGAVQQIQPDGWAHGSGYAHGTAARGRTICAAGQVGWDPRTQQLVSADFAAQAAQALANVAAVLRAAGARAEHLARLTWFITDRQAYLDARAAIGVAYRAHFGRHFPAMSVVVVAALLEPGALVEIEATAIVPE